MLRDPQALFPGQRRMVQYDFTDDEINALVAFLKWIGEMDLNGFPPKPSLLPWQSRSQQVVMPLRRSNGPRCSISCVLRLFKNISP
jgi:hypothetical protein